MLAHAAAFAFAKPVYFTCALKRTAGLAARIGTPELPDGNERLAKGGKPVLTLILFFNRIFFCFGKCAPKIFIFFLCLCVFFYYL